jgi:hypothetical protein
MFGIDDEIVPACLERKSAGAIKFEPDVRSRGRLTKRWGLWVNVEVGGE